MRQLQHTILWQKLDQPGIEYCHLSSHDEGWQLMGTVVLTVDDHPAEIRYQVLCNHLWQTRTVNVTVNMGQAQRTIRMIVDKRHRWWGGDDESYEEIIHLRGCVDVDLGITPATNTLPIRRAPLAIGHSLDLKAAWIRFPGLDVETLPQRYTRLTEHRYQYESRNGAYTAEIEVDAMGLVIEYSGGWERIATQTVGELLYPSLGAFQNQ